MMRRSTPCTGKAGEKAKARRAKVRAIGTKNKKAKAMDIDHKDINRTLQPDLASSAVSKPTAARAKPIYSAVGAIPRAFGLGLQEARGQTTETGPDAKADQFDRAAVRPERRLVRGRP